MARRRVSRPSPALFALAEVELAEELGTLQAELGGEDEGSQEASEPGEEGEKQDEEGE